ncbi:MAG: carboxymuconolactone decarboxylase family protein [Planctomycetes bacterium]|nr:carboxymuconolactone decarboxylase family protein [Planctomycetota bacterium]
MFLNVLHTDNALQGAGELLGKAQKEYGFVPNLLGVMAHAPKLLEGYMTLSRLFDQSSLDATERQVVLLAVSAVNRCHYCVPAYTVIAKMQGVESNVIEAIRDDRPIDDPKLQALRQFAAEMATTRGWPSDEAKQTFHEVGYTEAQALEVVLGVGLKTLSNYTNHLADTPLDDAFADAAWSPGAARA